MKRHFPTIIVIQQKNLFNISHSVWAPEVDRTDRVTDRTDRVTDRTDRVTDRRKDRYDSYDTIWRYRACLFLFGIFFFKRSIAALLVSML